MVLQILDCTLRDGGYYTNWDFKPELVQKYIQTLSDLPIHYLEIGYRNLPQSQYVGEYFYLPHFTLQQILNFSRHKNCKIAVMLDAKNCNVDDIPKLLGNYRDVVELVRIAVNPQELEHGISVAQAVKNLGFRVAVNLMYLSKLINNYNLISIFKTLGDTIDYLYLVDSYGSCYPAQVEQAIKFAKDNLPQKIGFHSHDNLGLAFANTLAALNSGVDIVDATVLGMGRGAGNLRTELIVAYLAQFTGKMVDLSPLADLLIDFHALKDEYKWGSDLPYIISGLSDLPQKDVMEWLSKKRHSTATIVQTIQGNAQEALTNNSYPLLKDNLENLKLADVTTCIIVGGGETAFQHRHAIIEYARKCQGLLIHSSLKNAKFYSHANLPQILCLPGREIEKLKFIADEDLEQQFSAYILSVKSSMVSTVLANLQNKTFEVEPISKAKSNSAIDIMDRDSPLGLALAITKLMNPKQIFLSGFDGYPNGTSVAKELATEVQEIIDLFNSVNQSICLQSLTKTEYNIKQSSVYALLI